MLRTDKVIQVICSYILLACLSSARLPQIPTHQPTSPSHSPTRSSPTASCRLSMLSFLLTTNCPHISAAHRTPRRPTPYIHSDTSNGSLPIYVCRPQCRTTWPPKAWGGLTGWTRGSIGSASAWEEWAKMRCRWWIWEERLDMIWCNRTQ